MNARLFFLTLLANNLPESGERQYQNKAARHPDAMASIMERTKRKKFSCHLSAKRNASAVSGAAQHRNPTQAA